MLQTKFPKLSVDAYEAWEQVPVDILTGTFAEHLDDAGLVKMRSLSKAYKLMFGSDDLWLDRLTLLSIRFPIIADLAKGAEETVMAWYGRCSIACDDGTALAIKHVENKSASQAYLELFGNVDGNSFTPFATLQFPIPRGFIYELIALKGRAGCSDPPMDALLCFPGAPASADGAFRFAFTKIKKLRAPCTKDNLRTLPDELASMYAPEAQAKKENTSSRSLDVLQRRLGHKSAALVKADERVEKLDRSYCETI
jgi:hypothetical protein